MPYLVLKQSDGMAAQYWNLHEGAMTFGRSDQVNAQVEDPELSREHFSVIQEGKKFVIKDLGSKNGTFVNGQRITEHPLKPHDLIQAGKSHFSFMEGLTTLAMKLDDDIKKLSKFSDPDQPAKP